MHTDVERAYLAGLIDGEGTIMIPLSRPRPNGETRTHALHVTVSNTHIPTMEHLKARWNGSLSIRAFSSGLSTRPIGVLRWTSLSAATVLREIEPYMRVKREQAQLGLLFADELAARPKVTSIITRDEWDRREHLRTAISRLNRPGIETQPEAYPELEPRPCEWCGEVYNAYLSRKRKFCTNSCAQKAARAAYRERNAQ